MGLVIQLIELSTTLLEWDPEDITENQILTIIMFMMIKQDKINMIESDPNQFISDEENEFTIKEIRSWWIDFILELIETLDNLQAVIKVVGKLFILNNKEILSNINKNYNENNKIILLEDNPEEFQIKRKEIGIHWLGELSDIIEDKIDEIDFSISVVLNSIIVPIFDNSSSYPIYLQGRALWFIHRIKNLIQSLEERKYIYSIAQEYFINSNSLVIKLTACKVMISYKEWLWVDNLENILNSLFELLEVSNLDTVPIPLEFLREFSNVFPDLKLLINENIINGTLLLFKRYHYDSIVGDDFLLLLSKWIELDINLVCEYIFQFTVDIIKQYHLSNTISKKESADELIGNSIFTYSVDLLKLLLTESQKSEKWPTIITNDFVKFQAEILLMSDDVYVLIHLLKLFGTTINAMQKIIVGDIDTILWIRQVINRFFDENLTKETWLLHIGGLLSTYLLKICQNPLTEFSELIENLVNRLLNWTSPNILESLLHPIFEMFLNYEDLALVIVKLSQR